MKEVLMSIITSYYTWIVLELIIAAVLVFFVAKYSRANKEIKKSIGVRKAAHQYQELDEMLVNKKRRPR